LRAPRVWAALAGCLSLLATHFGTAAVVTNSLLFTGITRLDDGSIRLAMSGATGAVYLLQFSTNWANWSPLAVFTNTFGLFQFTDAPPADLRRFYRLQSAVGTNSVYWTNAQETHNFIVGNLLTSYNSYRIEPSSSTSYEWYAVSQIYADAAMVLYGDSRYNAYMNNAYAW